MPNSITVENLSKRYSIGSKQQETMIREALVNFARHPFRRRNTPGETIWALKDVSFVVGKSEVVGVIGRNGAGKSTLLKILSKITYPTSGSIKVEGCVTSLLEVGTGFHEELTGRENIYLNGSILGMKRREINAKIDAIVDFAGVSNFLDTRIKFYSSGMRLRLGFAVAAHLDTELLLVDEVLAVGDADFQKKCLRKMESLHNAGRTVLFISHNLLAVEHLCPRVIWIDGGKVRCDGDAREVIQAYMATFSQSQRDAGGLLNVGERKGTGDIQFRGIEFLDSEGQPQLLTRTGDSLTVRLHYFAKRRVQETEFGISLWAGLGTLVAALSTATTGFEVPPVPPGKSYIDITIDALNLVPGRYSIALWATGPNHYGRPERCYDVVDHCAELDIEPSDFYKSGKGVHRAFGLVVVPCRWKLAAEHGEEESGKFLARAQES
jgi:lipopolysaccharide transport system ATP-binding protein